MIKINLLRDVTEVNRTRFTSVTTLGGGSGSGSENVVKIGLMLVPVIGLMFFEQYNLSTKKGQYAALQEKVADTRKNVEKLKPEIEEVKRFQKEKSRLTIQVDTIKKLSKERLQNVKALSALQTIIPTRAWLESIKIEKDKEKDKERIKVTLSGFATEDVVVSEFMGGLEQSIFFSNVTLKDSVDAKTTDGTVKSFNVECVLENI